jgi:hypothetical protein
MQHGDEIFIGRESKANPHGIARLNYASLMCDTCRISARCSVVAPSTGAESVSNEALNASTLDISSQLRTFDGTADLRK